jgi:hypothetical protein
MLKAGLATPIIERTNTDTTQTRYVHVEHNLLHHVVQMTASARTIINFPWSKENLLVFLLITHRICNVLDATATLNETVMNT